MDKEIWKAISGYEYYQVSNLGRVKSLARFRETGTGGYTQKERYLSLSISSNGYLQCSLCKKGIVKRVSVSVMVSMAFLGHRPDGWKIVVDHIDFNKQNNRPSNLRLISQRENSNRKHLKSSSQYTGVSFYKRTKKWRSSMTINGKSVHIGMFINEIDASEAYQKAISDL